jgi:hypothetical protein
MIVTWRGVIPIDFSMPRSRRRSRVLRTTVLKTPSAATTASRRVSNEAEPMMTAAIDELPSRAGKIRSPGSPAWMATA